MRGMIEVESVTIGERILARRTTLKITQREIAQSLGVTPQHISLIEQNKTAPSLTLLAGLAKELGTTADFLISGKEGKTAETISAIKADNKLTLKTKKALIALVEESYSKVSNASS
jgi:transcriptional regulator with XRE-family HTH domain